jgi:hypothetical protein
MILFKRLLSKIVNKCVLESVFKLKYPLRVARLKSLSICILFAWLKRRDYACEAYTILDRTIPWNISFSLGCDKPNFSKYIINTFFGCRMLKRYWCECSTLDHQKQIHLNLWLQDAKTLLMWMLHFRSAETNTPNNLTAVTLSILTNGNGKSCKLARGLWKTISFVFVWFIIILLSTAQFSMEANSSIKSQVESGLNTRVTSSAYFTIMFDESIGRRSVDKIVKKNGS